MSRTESGEAPKGYIVKLYKRVTNISNQEIIDGSMFMTWMNFDCMDIVGVHQFQDFNNSIDLKTRCPREEYASRQKFFLYCLDQDKKLSCGSLGNDEILSTDETFKNFPLITLTMLDIRKDSDCQADSQSLEKLNGFLVEYEKRNETIRGCVFGSLSMYDYVLILRGNDYRKMDDALAACREKTRRAGIIFNRMYTIAGINRKHASAWKADGLKVSVRLSCTSDITAQWLRDDKILNEALNIQEIYSILGKYDFDVEGEIKSAEKFTELFCGDGPLSAKKNNIHKTNTRFLNSDGWQAGDPCPEPENFWGNDVLAGVDGINNDDGRTDDTNKVYLLLEKYYELYERIEDLSFSICEALSRLILRTFQAVATTSNPKMAEDLDEKMSGFLEFIAVSQKDVETMDVRQDEVQDVYVRMINTFNLLLDNRVLAGISDFETPQNVLRYSGSSMKVLLAYSDFVNGLIKILSYNKKNERKESGSGRMLKYLVFVTADPANKITAEVSLSYSDQYRFINIKVPIDLMFDVRNVLPWITHEVGHFVRAGWNRKNRNAAYFQSVSRGVINSLIPFADSRIDQALSKRNNKETILKTASDESDDGCKFDAYCEYVKQYFQTVIYGYETNYSMGFKIPHNKARKLLENVSELTKGLQRIYEESIADLFMLRVLEIEKLEDYLRIQAAYFERMHIEIQQLPQENVSRIVAVSAVLGGYAEGGYEEVKRYFKDGCDNEDEQILSILDKLINYKKYYLLEPLVVFLDKYVKAGLDQLLMENELSWIWKKMKDSYSRLKTGGFEDYIWFMQHFNEELALPSLT